MNTTETTANTTFDETKGFWVRRTLAPLGIAAGLALALGLSACGTDQAIKRTSVDAETTPSVAADELGSSTTSVDSSAVAVSDPETSNSGSPSNSGSGGGSGNGSGGGSGNGSGGNSGNTAPAPVITSFNTPENIDCHNGNFQEFTASWTTTNASKVTISIDGPGVYAEYPANGETSLPFSCSSSHTFLLTAYNEHGAQATRSITLDPRNVQSDTPADEDEDL